MPRITDLVRGKTRSKKDDHETSKKRKTLTEQIPEQTKEQSPILEVEVPMAKHEPSPRPKVAKKSKTPKEKGIIINEPAPPSQPKSQPVPVGKGKDKVIEAPPLPKRQKPSPFPSKDKRPLA